MTLFKSLLFALAACAATATLTAGQLRPAPPVTPRIYIFDNGRIAGLDTKLFGLRRVEQHAFHFLLPRSFAHGMGKTIAARN